MSAPANTSPIAVVVIDREKTQVELEQAAGRKALARHQQRAVMVAPRGAAGPATNDNTKASGATGPSNMPAHDKDIAGAFLSSLDPNASRFTFQFFGDGAGTYAEIFHGTLDEVWPKVQALNTPTRRCGAFVTINETDFKGRSKENIVRPRALFVDADSDEQVKRCIQTFYACDAAPSRTVKSGRGLHFYFCADVPRDQFTALQKALANKVGTDPAVHDLPRVMRLPGTLHLKDPTNPRLVKLSRSKKSPRWKFAELVATLGLSPTAAVAGRGTMKKATNVIQLDPALFPKRPIPPEGIEVLGEGCGYEDVPLDWAPLVGEGGCGFIRRAMDTGGSEYAQPLWNLTTLVATFLEDGHALAHKMGNQHEDYTPESTDVMWERKLRERKEKGLGWPSCNAIQAAGCTDCASCPHFSKGKSPLHLTVLAAPTADPSQADYRGGDNGRWPNWPDPLDFHQVPIEEAIARVNAAGYFVLTLNGDIYKIEPGGGVTVQKREGFTNLFACRQARYDEDKLISAGTAWKRSTKRREYHSIGYWPGNHGRPTKSYNLWQGWGIEPKQGDWSIIYDHILNVIADGDKDKANYILDWSAHMVQRPREKPGVALVLRGRKGTGKTLLTQILARVIGGQNTLITASGKKLFGTFNWHLADKLLIGAEEAFFVGNREVNDQLKHLLTGDEIEVEQKFGQRISMKSMHRVIMTSNHDQVIAASDDERRFFVCDVSDKRRGDDVYFAPLVRVIKGDDDATLAAFMRELQTRAIKNWKPEQAARNAASIDLARQKLLSLEPPLQWLLEEAANLGVAVVQTAEDVGYPTESDLAIDQHIKELREIAAGPHMGLDKQHTSTREMPKDHMLASYRYWAKTAQVRGAIDFTSAEIFWASIKRLLNKKIFPGPRLFRSSGGKRFVLLPAPQEMLDGFNRLLGGKVVDVDEDV